MIYEWRVYEIIPGKKKLLNERFAKHTIGLFEKHGMTVVGFWENVIGGRTNTLYYMLAFKKAFLANEGANPVFYVARDSVVRTLDADNLGERFARLWRVRLRMERLERTASQSQPTSCCLAEGASAEGAAIGHPGV